LPRAWARAWVERTHGVEPGDRVLVSVARICPQKNQLGLLAAFEDALRADERLVLLLAGGDGDPAYGRRVRAAAAAPGLRGRARPIRRSRRRSAGPRSAAGRASGSPRTSWWRPTRGCCAAWPEAPPPPPPSRPERWRRDEEARPPVLGARRGAAGRSDRAGA